NGVERTHANSEQLHTRGFWRKRISVLHRNKVMPSKRKSQQCCVVGVVTQNQRGPQFTAFSISTIHPRNRSGKWCRSCLGQSKVVVSHSRNLHHSSFFEFLPSSKKVSRTFSFFFRAGVVKIQR